MPQQEPMENFVFPDEIKQNWWHKIEEHSPKILGKCSKLYVVFIENIKKTVEWKKKYNSKEKEDMSNILPSALKLR